MRARFGFLMVVGAVVVIGCRSDKPTYRVGGTVSGLAGAGLVLQNNAGDDLTLGAGTTTFAFPAALRDGAAYAVTVKAQPTNPWQTCAVTGGTGAGTVAGAQVSVTVACTTNTLPVAVTVTGLAGSGLVVANGTDTLTFDAGGAATQAFATRVASGASYAVTLAAQPTSPWQTCAITGGTGAGAVAGTAVAVDVACTTDTHLIGVSVTGLAGAGLVVGNGADTLTFEATGATAKAFTTPVSSGAGYAVTILAQPTQPWQTCTVTGGAGTVAGTDVAVDVACTTNTAAVTVSVSGLAGAGLVLANGADVLTFAAGGAASATFATRVPSGAGYAVTVLAQPANPTQTCTIAGGTGAGTVLATDVAVDVACTTNTYSVAVSVSGLAGAGLVVGNGADTLNFDTGGAATQTFATRVASGAGYAVTFLAQPTQPWQTCAVTGGTGAGTVLAADVTIAVACTTNTYAIGVRVGGLAGAGLVLASGADTLTFDAGGAATRTFATRVPSGGSYAVTFQAQPTNAWQSCAFPSGTGAGAVAGADVTVDVTCTTLTFPITTTVSGLAGTGLVLTGTFGTAPPVDSPPIAADGVVPSMTNAGVASGSSYTITVRTLPHAPIQACTIAGGASVTGTVANAPIAVAVSCAAPATVVQEWTAPTSWGGTAAGSWPDADPDLVQHATFRNVATGGSYLVETKSAWPATWTGPAGTEPAPLAFTGFPVGTRHAGGPFPTVGRHYQAAVPDPRLDVGKRGDASTDLLVCAIVKPDYDPIFDGQEHPIIAKGVGNSIQDLSGGGWVLMQMHDSFCFHYEAWDGVSASSSRMTMVFTPSYFAAQDPNHAPFPMRVSPLNPSYVVVCAGRDGNTLRIAMNGFQPGSSSSVALPLGAVWLDAGSSHPLTLGGYHATTFTTPPPAPKHVFGGRIYETAVWKVAATPANLQARLNAVQGLPPGATYSRNREGPYQDAAGGYHTAWRNGPRFDTAKGLLLGLQGWNRLSSWKAVPGSIPDVAVYANGEAFDLWTPTSGLGAPTVVNDANVMPPGDALTYSQRVMLPAGASLSVPLGAFEAVGTIHGQIWLRVPTAAGTLRIRTTNPAVGGSDHFDVNLAALTPSSWTRVWLHRGSGGDGNELTTAAQPAIPPTLFLENPDAAQPITFYAWGFDLTQLGGGVSPGADLGSFDPGLAMYDWGADQDVAFSGSAHLPLDVLTLEPVPDTTAETGFCLSADAQPAAGLGWTAPLNEQRNVVAWRHATQDLTARLFVDGGANAGTLCFTLGNGTDPTPPVACGSVPGSWAPGSKHTVRGCLSAAGQLRVFAGDVPVGTPVTVPAATVPDLLGGSIRIGNSGSKPWHGYVSRALACRDTGVIVDCR